MKSKTQFKQLLLLLLVFTFSAAITFGQNCGDINTDGSTDIVDALLVAQCYVGLTSCPSAEIGDVNCDGSIDIIDGLLIAQLYVGLINTLTCCDTPTDPPEITPDPTPGADVTLELQAEDATWDDAAVESEHSGYTGSGYVNTANSEGRWIEWIVDVSNACNAVCVFTYATSGSGRPMDLSVSGSVSTNLSFPDTGAWTTWSTQTADIILNAGSNAIRLTATSSGGAPNMDKMDITISGGEVVTPPPTPTPTSTPDPTATPDPNVTPVPGSGEVDGYAGSAGTTGGGNASSITVSSASAFKSAVGNDNPAVIIVNGRLDVGTIKIGSNKTIIGANSSAGLYGGDIQVQGTNYIFKNLTFGPSGNDAMEISGATKVFVTKCTFHDSSDELCSIVRASDYVTVSWSYFYFDNSSSHSFAHLISSSDDHTGDRGKLHITLHHNWYGKGIRGRIPRVRFGYVHIYNNYLNSTGTGYCIGTGKECHIRVENTHFDNVSNIWKDHGDDGIIGWDNLLLEGSSLPTYMPNSYPAFDLPYSYNMDPVNNVESIVKAGAGNVF